MLLPFVISSPAGQVEPLHGIPESLAAHRLPMSDCLYADCPFGVLLFQMISAPGWKGWKTKFFITADVELNLFFAEPFISLYIAQKGGFPIKSGSQISPAGPGSFCLCQSSGDRVLLLKARTEYEAFEFMPRPGPMSPFGIGTVSGKMQRLLKTIEEPLCSMAAYPSLMKSRFGALIGEALRILGKEKKAKSFVLTPAMKDKAVLAKKILDERVSNPPTLKRLAQLCTSNSHSIQKAFKALFGITIKAHSIHVRMDCAKVLLTTTEDPIDDIAEASGYCDAASFSRRFKKHVGFTPGEFRKYGKDV